jgi:hypothetical protein
MSATATAKPWAAMQPVSAFPLSHAGSPPAIITSGPCSSNPRDFGTVKWPSSEFCFGPPQANGRVL